MTYAIYAPVARASGVLLTLLPRLCHCVLGHEDLGDVLVGRELVGLLPLGRVQVGVGAALQQRVHDPHVVPLCRPVEGRPTVDLEAEIIRKVRPVPSFLSKSD